MIVERLDPETTEDAFQRVLHLERYRWAKERLTGRRILDAACGLGYGSAILAEGGAREVLGVDRDEAALATARSRHAGEGVRFERVEDLLLPDGPLAGAGRYDTIVSLETLEHLDRPVAFLRQAHRLLAPGGRLILSAPVQERPGENPYHLHCFTAATLLAVAGEGFTKEDELLQANGAYLTLALRRKEEPCPAWVTDGGDSPARATVLLVTWNSQERVIELVRALRAFTARPYELLVIDNGSTDGVASFLELYRGEPGCRLVRNPENRRLAAATNQGLSLCGTEYLVYLCASHALVTEPDWLGRLLSWIDERPEVALAGDVWAPGYSLESQHYRPGWTPDPTNPPGHVQGGAWIARPGVLLERGGFAEDEHPHVGMDLELSHRLVSWGEKLGDCPLVRSPAWPEEPELGEAVVYHPASAAVRAQVLARIEGRAEPLPALLEGAAPRLPDGFGLVRGEAEPLPGGLLRVRAHGPDSGLLSRERFRDVRVRAKVRYSGQAIVKVRQGSRSSDGYHVLLGQGADYLARNDHVLARLPSSPGAIDLELLARGHELVVSFDGREVARVTDHLLEGGHVLLGANRGEAVFADLVLEPLDEPRGGKPAAIVFSEHLPNESFCAAIVRELGAFYDVRPCGPGWPVERLLDVDPSGVAFCLELDAASGSFVRPEGLERLHCPKFAWLIDTHKKIEFHRQIAREVDLTFYAPRAWGHVFDRPAAWLPLHADQEIFRPRECARDLDLVFVGSQTWRADPLRRLAKRHGLRVEVATTTGPREKSETAALYARAKLVFNKQVTNDLNFRVFEATAAGRVLLTDAQWNGQYELFEEDRHLVYYKDERDLERQVLRLLGDEELRGRIEREAAAWAHAHHTTRARVAQLAQAIKAHLPRTRGALRPAPAAAPISPVRACAEPRPAAAPTTTAIATGGPGGMLRARWLVLAGPEPEAVWLASWAERLATLLAANGQEVVLARERRTSVGAPRQGDRRPGASHLFELERGPLPAAPTPTNDMLAGAAPLQRRLSQLMASEGPFDFLLAEGALGALVGPSLAARSGVPLLFLLSDCEVTRRGNQLTREQLYLAELEHWGAERAARVLVPTAEVAEAARQHYRVTDPLVCPVPPADLPPLGRDALLLERLGLQGCAGENGRPILVLASGVGMAEREALLGAGLDQPLLLAGEGLLLARPGSAAVRLARQSPRGPALGSLLRSAGAVLLADRLVERRADAERLGRRIGRVALEAGHARDGLERGLAAAREPGLPSFDPTRLVATLLGAVAARPPISARSDRAALVEAAGGAR